jgi:hypothetical protein
MSRVVVALFMRGRFCANPCRSRSFPAIPFVHSSVAAADPSVAPGAIVNSPAGQIEFTLENEAHVRIEVFDVRGRAVATLADEKVSAGAHRYRWDSRGFPSGVYFYSVRSEDYLKAGKILVAAAER